MSIDDDDDDSVDHSAVLRKMKSKGQMSEVDQNRRILSTISALRGFTNIKNC